MNLRFFKLDRVSLASLNMPNDGEFSWRWFLKHCIKGTFCRRVFTSFITRLIRKFYLLLVQLTLMKCIQKCVMDLQCCCFAYSPIVVVVFLTFSLPSTSWFMMIMATAMIMVMMTMVVMMNGLNFVSARFDFFIASNLQIAIIILITFSGQFACGWI